ncbi:TPA: hypothetical protein HA338_14350 [Methanosarcina acetivorans]|uniref:Archaeal Type IV pilin N-terminal domain-containing protein n=2 Tax=Methanosarcina acetivorans TaxID=2214 RepID=Q8TU45_METAC|nr:hypothetical protein [Methanosarcina acetivorans]AAM03682.1 predicted protein [Methanosarcina acetivorans C2A]HIH95142.1 hypothetical protein [Methanosarcina acetivorans]
MKNRFFESISSFCSSEYGVSSAVAAALLLGIIVAAMTTIQLNYVPVWKEDAEYAHMSNVWQDMSRLKSNVDILVAGLEINPDARIVLNSPIQVGGNDVPFIGGTTTGGTLAVNNEISGLSIVVTTDNATTEYNSGTSLFYTGTVTYSPTNTHYVDETYCYENGALIVSRNGRSMMKLSPGMVLERDTGSVNLSVRAVTLDGNRGVMASNSIEDIRLTSEYFTPLFDLTGIEQFFNITSVNLTVYTENQEAWERYFENSAGEIDLQEGTDYNLTNGTYTVTFSLSPEDEDLYVNVYKAAIKVETGI